jgi:hypothetical protein
VAGRGPTPSCVRVAAGVVTMSAAALSATATERCPAPNAKAPRSAFLVTNAECGHLRGCNVSSPTQTKKANGFPSAFSVSDLNLLNSDNAPPYTALRPARRGSRLVSW